MFVNCGTHRGDQQRGYFRSRRSAACNFSTDGTLSFPLAGSHRRHTKLHHTCTSSVHLVEALFHCANTDDAVSSCLGRACRASDSAVRGTRMRKYGGGGGCDPPEVEPTTTTIACGDRGGINDNDEVGGSPAGVELGWGKQPAPGLLLLAGARYGPSRTSVARPTI
jgi:hypothetical protein